MKMIVICMFLYNNPLSWDINSMNLPCSTSFLPGDTLGSQISSFGINLVKKIYPGWLNNGCI